MKNIVLITAALGTLALASNCTISDDVGVDVSSSTELTGRWAIDMTKVEAHYGTTTSAFLGFSHAEAGLPPIPGTEQAMIWDQTAKRDADGSLHPEPGDEYAVIAKDGEKIDPLGYVNLIPMLRDTDPTEQKHIKALLNDGDILVYVHPEYAHNKAYMERRASHVAMHYEHVTADGKEVVHHIDNPNSYGPIYNHPANKHMPFHVYRLRRPAEYGRAARNWAMLNNDLSPFAGFFELSLKTRGDLDQFAHKAIRGEDMPGLYCSGLAYANTNLALSFPLNEEGLGPQLWPIFKAASYGFSDTRESLTAEQLAVSDSVKPEQELVFPPYLASDIIDAWIEVNMAHLPMAARQQIVAAPDFQQELVRSLANLEWCDRATHDKQSSVAFKPATPENVKRWASAYGLDVGATQSYLDGDPELKAQVAEHAVDTDGKTPMEVFKALESILVESRFVPPRIWMDEADRVDSNIMYVGTVVNCELLTAVDGSGGDPCSGGSQAPPTSFQEGAADTSTYGHYRVLDGGERTHRRFEVSYGPQQMGGSTTFTLRATAASAKDVMFIVHTPQSYSEFNHRHDGGEALDTLAMSANEYDSFCSDEADRGATCAPSRGIAIRISDHLDNGEGGPLVDRSFSFDLADLCAIDDEEGGAMECDVARRRPDGNYEVSREKLSRAAHGLWSATIVELGADSSSRNLANCEECSRGGAHYNQWVLRVQ